MKIIGSSAFKNYKLTSVELPNTIATIESTAFYDNSLKEIIIPDSVKTIGNLAFAGNKLSSVIIKNTEGNVRFGATPFGTFDISNTKWES